MHNDACICLFIVFQVLLFAYFYDDAINYANNKLKQSILAIFDIIIVDVFLFTLFYGFYLINKIGGAYFEY